MNIKHSSKENKKIRKQREYRKKCEDCGVMAKAHRIFDIDGTNLVEHFICLKCDSGKPALL